MALEKIDDSMLVEGDDPVLNCVGPAVHDVLFVIKVVVVTKVVDET